MRYARQILHGLLNHESNKITTKTKKNDLIETELMVPVVVEWGGDINRGKGKKG